MQSTPTRGTQSVRRAGSLAAHRGAPARPAETDSGRRRGPSRYIAALVLGVALTFLQLVAPASPASAYAPPTDQRVRATQTFNAYVAAGEQLFVNFTKPYGSRPGTPDARVIVTDPAGVTRVCNTLVATAATGSACNWNSLTSTTSGVWSIQFLALGGNQTTSGHTWDISVRASNGTTVRPGRLYSENYVLSQATIANVADLRLWYATVDGYRYQVDLKGYRGIDSNLNADPVGLESPAGSCIPVYGSSPAPSEAALSPLAPHGTPTRGGCGDPVKIFFETPDPTMPATATSASGTEWLLPAPVTPVLSNPTFAPTTPTSRSGTFTVAVQNFTGNMSIEVDANGNGVFGEPEDRTIPAFSDGSPAVSVDFDGLDGLGNPIPSDQAFTFRTRIDRAGEVHFMSPDVEGRGGITVTALNGPNAGTPHASVIYWDDTGLAADQAAGNQSRCSTTPVPDGTAGVDSAVSAGVHGWGSCSTTDSSLFNPNDGIHGPWGDARNIEEWTYQRLDVAVSLTVPAIEDPCVVDPAAEDCLPVPLLDLQAGAVATGLAVATMGAYLLHRRRSVLAP